MKKVINSLLVIIFMLFLVSTGMSQSADIKLGGKTHSESFEILDSDDKVIFQVKGNGKTGIGSSVLKSFKLHVQGSINSQGVYKITGKTVLSKKGTNNTYVGEDAGKLNAGANNVFLGHHAGYNESGSDKLYIDNSNTSSPLIWGDFSADSVNINGDLQVTGAMDVSSTTGALIVPRMTTTQRDNLPTIDGSIVYNTTTNEFNFRENGAWVTK
jgi:hypothetical protein